MLLYVIRVWIAVLFILTAQGVFADAQPLQFFVSVAPQRSMVQRIAGSKVLVDVLVQPGQDPHTYEPTSRLISRLAQADVYVRIGVPFENAWITRIQAMNPHMEVLDLSAGLSLPWVKPAPASHQDVNITELDPHLWTSPPLMRLMSGQLRNYLIQRDPNHAAMYNDGYNGFVADLDALDRDIRSILARNAKPCRFMVFHPAWGHFAAAYGLTQIAIEHNDKTPGAKTLGGLIDQARHWGLRIIFVQPQFDRKTAQTLAEAINGRTEILDPMAEDYFGNMRRMAQQIAKSCYP